MRPVAKSASWRHLQDALAQNTNRPNTGCVGIMINRRMSQAICISDRRIIWNDDNVSVQEGVPDHAYVVVAVDAIRHDDNRRSVRCDVSGALCDFDRLSTWFTHDECHVDVARLHTQQRSDACFEIGDDEVFRSELPEQLLRR